MSTTINVVPQGSATLRLSRSGPAPVTQNGSAYFYESTASGVDSSASLSDVNLDAATTKLGVNVDLKAGVNYSFSFYYKSGAPKVTLIDASGKKTSVSMSKGFTVKASGSYQLVFEANYSLKNAGLDNLAINARAVLPKSSGNKQIDALLYGGTGSWFHDFDVGAVQGAEKIAGASALIAGSALTDISYAFLKTQPTGQSMTGFQEMTAAQKNAVRKAFDFYGKVLNVHFTEVAPGRGQNISLGTNNQSSSAGYATTPDKNQSFLFLANNVSTNDDTGVQEGGYGYETILHEIGHTLGLKHPGNYNAGGGGTPAPYLPKNLDNRQYSVMSYYNDSYTSGVNPTTPMTLDIAALQYIYGANKSATTATTNSFTFDSSSNYLQTLWSPGATDTIDLSQLTNSSKVDLNAGAYSSINIVGAATNPYYSGNFNVGIAYGSQINNVTLSSTTGIAETVTLNKAYGSGLFDTITSFDATDDKIALKKSLFGALSAKNILFGTAATSKDTKIIVNSTTGEVFYDADGSGTKSAAKKIAQFTAVSGRGALTAANFSIVA